MFELVSPLLQLTGTRSFEMKDHSNAASFTWKCLEERPHLSIIIQ